MKNQEENNNGIEKQKKVNGKVKNNLKKPKNLYGKLKILLIVN